MNQTTMFIFTLSVVGVIFLCAGFISEAIFFNNLVFGSLTVSPVQIANTHSIPCGTNVQVIFKEAYTSNHIYSCIPTTGNQLIISVYNLNGTYAGGINFTVVEK